jgi:large subunit ribosomal protein L3
MPIGIVGRKCGMTRVFNEDGGSVPVTVIEVQPNRIVQVKTRESDGYRAVQVASGTRRLSKLNKPMGGRYGKSGVAPGLALWEFRLREGEGDSLSVGDEIRVTILEVGQQVDAAGTSIGKGYAGVVKRHNFRTQDATHGNSLSHRAAGSVGQNQSPGRVFKGKRMAGQLGSARRTVQNLHVVRVDEERNLVLVRGAVPGPRGGAVVLSPAAKVRTKKSD